MQAFEDCCEAFDIEAADDDGGGLVFDPSLTSGSSWVKASPKAPNPDSEVSEKK